MIHQFNRICEFRRNNPGIRGSGISVTDPILGPVNNDLDSIREYLTNNFQNYRGFEFTFERSRGQTYYPSILHVSILPPDQTVSCGIYVVICFDILGRGAVVGCGESVTNPRGLNTIVRKRKGLELNIDVDGLRSTTKYNNAFENPMEFYAGLHTDTDLLSHISRSLDLALYHLGLDDNPELDIAVRVNADRQNFEFDPANTADARDRIARQITARRGQKGFRNKLLRAYNNRCAITGSNVEAVLEAAHILPYNGVGTNHVQNGILLRSDIHTLFDMGFIAIEPETYRVRIHPELIGSEYEEYNDRILDLPQDADDMPNVDVLKHHYNNRFRDLLIQD